MTRILRIALLCGVLLGTDNLAWARNQWDTNHGGTQQQYVDPRLLPGGQWSGYVKPGAPGMNIWQGQLNRKIPAGTVLTAILEDDLDSSKTLKGDTFALTLQDGFIMNGNTLVPPNSKIVGTVLSSISAKLQRAGHPGSLEISLQSLVFPDGTHMPIHAVIDANPNHSFKKPPLVRNAGHSIKDYGQSVSSMAMSFVSGPGFMQKKFNRGNEFVLDKGEAIAVRLTRSIDVPEAPATPTNGTLIAQPPAGGAVGSDSSQLPYPPGTVAGQPQQVPISVPGLVDPQGPFQIPGLVPVQQQAYGSVGMPPVAPPYNNGAVSGNAGLQAPTTPPTLNDLPDPF